MLQLCNLVKAENKGRCPYEAPYNGTDGMLSTARRKFAVEGILVDTLSLEEASVRICDEVNCGDSFSVFTLNLDHIVKLRREPLFAQAYQRARIVLADGFPIALAGRLQGHMVSRCAGSDLIDPLCAEASHRGLPVIFFGSSLASLAAAAKRLQALHEGLSIAGVYSPPPAYDVLSGGAWEGIEFVRRSGAKICLVALGAPKQELFADRCASETQGISFVCIGAGLDFLAGHERRAPKIWRSLGCEWVWRLLSDPRRLAKRYLACLLVFPSVLREALSRKLMLRAPGPGDLRPRP